MPTEGRFRARPRWHRRGPDHTWHGPWDPELVRGRFSGRSPSWVRLWLPVVISLIVQVPSVLFDWGTGRRPQPSDAPPSELLLALGLALVGPLALIAARRLPGPVVALVALAAGTDLIISGNNDGPPYISFAFAIGAAIVRGARVWAWVSIAVAWTATITVATLVGIDWQPWRVAGITVGILLVVGAAEGVRTRSERFERYRAQLASRRQSEVQAERVRIARELHDVLAHSLSQINVQAGVGLHLMEKQPDKAADALASIKETSKTALDEVRAVLGILRAEGGADPAAPLVPEPDLSRLAGLVASVTSQGVDVTLDNRLAAVPQATGLAVYRIVQESLTNVVRHANARRAVVELSETATHYRVAVTDDGTGPGDVRDDSGGRGLLGMHERAELLGGTLEAGPLPGGGFGVAATLPKKELPEKEAPQ